jgi:hypothetical protein
VTPDLQAALERVRSSLFDLYHFTGERKGQRGRSEAYDDGVDMVALIKQRIEERERERDAAHVLRDSTVAHYRDRAYAAEARIEALERALWLLASEETWATGHPHGAFGLPPNTWGPAPSWVRTLARHVLDGKEEG